MQAGVTPVLLLLASLAMGPPPATGALWWQRLPPPPVSPVLDGVPRMLPALPEPARRLP